jgi:hypothetical protein
MEVYDGAIPTPDDEGALEGIFSCGQFDVQNALAERESSGKWVGAVAAKNAWCNLRDSA